MIRGEAGASGALGGKIQPWSAMPSTWQDGRWHDGEPSIICPFPSGLLITYQVSDKSISAEGSLALLHPNWSRVLSQTGWITAGRFADSQMLGEAGLDDSSLWVGCICGRALGAVT